MIKNVLEGQTILPSPPTAKGTPVEPVVHLHNGLTLDDRTFESPFLILGNVGSGKSFLLEKIMATILNHAAKQNENVFIFCAKRDFLKYAREGDLVISVDTKDPAACWNIFRELQASRNPELTARDIAKSLTRDMRSDTQPFFANACNNILYSIIMAMYEDGIEKGICYTNRDMVDFINRTRLEGGEITWNELAELRPKYFSHLHDYLGDRSEQGLGVISELRTLVHDCFWGSFAAEGTFSAIETLKTGGKTILLYYDFANASEACTKIFSTILDLLFKHALDYENKRRTWFFLDEFSVLPKSHALTDAMSLGRSFGLRVFACQQSANLLTRHYKEDEAKTLLSLFPNVITLKVQDPLSRSVLADRYGKALSAYSFSAPMQKITHHVENVPVVADYHFSQIVNKGDAICSIPALSAEPFFYRGYRKELEQP